MYQHQEGLRLARAGQNQGGLGLARAGRYASIDIGTVTCRLLIADVDESGHLHELARKCEITDLGEGLNATGVLSAQAMKRVNETIKQYRAILDTFSPPGRMPVKVCAVATSAARDAKNADEFAALIADAGIALSVIPGKREAALSFKGASSDFLNERLIVVDIGGGSTELIAGLANEGPVLSESFNIGCRRATEKFFASDPPCESELKKVRAWILEGIRPFFEKLNASGFVADRIIAVAGTATTVISVYEEMEVYDPSRVHKSLASRSMLDEVYQRLASVPLSERKRITGLDPKRAPVIVAGLAILQEILGLASINSFTVSESDILRGIILDMAQC